MAHADGKPAGQRPGMMAGLETGAGVGEGVSYADTPGKASKAVVLADIESLSATLAASHSSFCGFNIHHWSSWAALPP